MSCLISVQCSCGEDLQVAKVLANTRVLEQMWLWRVELVSCARLCVGGHFSSKGAQKAGMNIFLFWALSPYYDSLGKYTFNTYPMPEKQGKQGPKTQEAQS